MDISQARKIIVALSDGINPITGEVFPKSHYCNEPEIIRALCVAAEELKKAEKRCEPENAGKPWNEDADNELKVMFLRKQSKEEMCSHFKRSKGAITSRLVRLGLIQSQDEF